VLEILSRCGGPEGIRAAGRRKLTAIATKHAPRMGARKAAGEAPRERGTVHWQPVSSSLLAMLTNHCDRGTASGEQLLRYRHGRPITRRRYDHLWIRASRELSWVATRQISTHWLRHAVLTWVEQNFGFTDLRDPARNLT
jgi:integrase